MDIHDDKHTSWPGTSRMKVNTREGEELIRENW
jgi:hypothetical protein